MTTLPQTTNVRVPRPVGTGAVLAPAAGHVAPQAGMTGSDVWRVLRANMWLIVGLVILSGGLGYGAYWYLGQYHSRYTAEGYVQIQPMRLTNLVKGEPLELNTQTLNIESRTQAQLLRTDALVSSVLLNPNSPIRETNWFNSFRREELQADGSRQVVPDIAAARKDLEKNFTVLPYPESKLIKITMTTANPQDSKVIVDTIVSQHINNQQDLNRLKQQQLSQDLNRMKGPLQVNLSSVTGIMREQLSRLSLQGITPGTTAASAKDIELRQLMDAQFEAHKEHQRLKSQLEMFTEQVNQGIDPPGVEEVVSRDPRIYQLQQQLDAAEMAVESNLRLGSDHQRMRELTANRDLLRQWLEDAKVEKRAQARMGQQQYLAGALTDAERTLTGVNERVNQLKTELGQLSYAMMEYLTKKDQAQYLQDQLKEVETRLADIQTITQQRSLATIDWVTTPTVPESRSFPKIEWVMAAALFIGLALSLGIAFLRELLDTSVRSPRDIQKVGQLNLLGMIPHEDDDPQSAGTPLPMVIVQAPTSVMAEQFRQVRTRLQHAASLDTTRSIVVTSPGPGDGKTTVAVNLAAGLALNGRRILLVDANLRRPELHKLFGVSNETGLTSVLVDLARFESSVSQTKIPNLDVLPAGPKASNPTELMESQLLIEFIERALEEYDHVVFDSGPILVVSETVALAPRVDGVVTVVRARNNSRGLLQRMRDQLRQLKSEHLGVVLNGVRAQGGGYYGRNIKTYYQYQNGHAN
jgi:polysaccharide biosynthesis transport protein